MKKSLRIIILISALVLIIGAIFLIRLLNSPPKYEEIEARFKQLMTDSRGVNEILFGEGLPTYERLSDPADSVSVYNTGEYYIDEDGDEHQRKVWYYYTHETKATVIAFRDSFLKDFSYACVAESEQTRESLAALFPAPEGDKTEYYGEVYRSEDGKNICYLIPYTEKKADFYYASTDPEDYDFVRLDAEYRTVDEIKAYVETVYSKSYALSIYSSTFDGVASGDQVMKARYAEHSRTGGASMLTKSNTFEPLYTEERVYLFDTARILYWESSKNSVRISIDSYLPSNPNKIQNMEITIVKQNGQWLLDGPTF